ncbi:SDR family oxidoreductase [Actinophytocola algeriensis]|uniref:NADP-dependent 3-hydroxy acid dehydrogenase YdfG n=1 Tax=Actinophytocola algeriensis TaxID=1768010 RepID=A0A7W7QAL1_9PSEU|nr:SDR family oxidoreductase [Actinophytocola algeriensis]MBB4910045.1 NADP-dependent 3-hydroxy acid dehydrogenase YdfG [Actinophytocola algeriensis]MBE1476035.1 NADP-dependent 3-hydroxy acid dehydrogenase YdfG [Actinophytocola algeriensis]
MSDVEGKVVAITGASSGIGAATAEVLASHGAKLVLGARREERLAAVADRLGAERLSVDVRRRADVADLVSLARKRFGRLDVLVSNAGVMPISLLDELRVDDWDAMVDVNLKGVLHGVAAALPVFREQGSGHFVHVASTAGLTIRPTMAVYAATKFAVRAFSEGLRQEAGDQVRVTIISPGMTATNSDTITDPAVLAGMAEYAMPPEAVARAIAYAVGQPADVDVNEIVIRPTAQA